MECLVVITVKIFRALISVFGLHCARGRPRAFPYVLRRMTKIGQCEELVEKCVEELSSWVGE